MQMSLPLFSDTYTKEWGDDLQKRIAEAQAMPNVGQRRGNTKAAGNGLDASSIKAVLVWKKLQRFIIKAFTPDEVEAALQQAGSTHYAKAAKLNFGELSLLMTAGQTFIEENTDRLIKGGMPASLPDDFTAVKNDFDTNHTAYGDAKGNATTGTSNKIEANNQLYAQVMNMFGDAQTIFAEQKNIAAQFSFQAIKRMVTKNGASGIHVIVKDSTTKKPLVTASVITNYSTESYAVNDRGSLLLKLPKGTYSVTITNPGYASFTKDITIDSTGMTRLSAELSKAVTVAVAS